MDWIKCKEIQSCSLESNQLSIAFVANVFINIANLSNFIAILEKRSDSKDCVAHLKKTFAS